MNTKAKYVILLVILVLALGALSKLTSRNTPSGTSCDTGATCSLPTASEKPGEARPDVAAVKGNHISPENTPRLIDLGSTTCIPCKMMVSVLDELSKEYKATLSVEFIDVSKDSAAARRYRVRGIPTQVFLDADGKEFFRHLGFYPKDDIVAKFKEHGINLEKEK